MPATETRDGAAAGQMATPFARNPPQAALFYKNIVCNFPCISNITTSRLIVLMLVSNFESTVSTAPSRSPHWQKDSGKLILMSCCLSVLRRQSTVFRFPGVKSCLGEGRFPVDIVLALTERELETGEPIPNFYFFLLFLPLPQQDLNIVIFDASRVSQAVSVSKGTLTPILNLSNLRSL